MEVLVAVAIGIGIFALALWAVRMLATPPPPEPDPEDVVEVTRDYRCTVCGMRVVVTHAQGAGIDAPRHCREDMVPA
jgi:hypothetical protein